MKKSTWVKKPVKQLLKKLEEEFNRYIRIRDSDSNGLANCISCNKQVQLGTIDCQAGHYVPVSMSSFWRFEEDNVNIQCSACNNWKSGNVHDQRQGMQNKYGVKREREIWTNRHKQVTKWDKEDLVKKIFYYQKQAEEIAQIKGLVV